MSNINSSKELPQNSTQLTLQLKHNHVQIVKTSYLSSSKVCQQGLLITFIYLFNKKQRVNIIDKWDLTFVKRWVILFFYLTKLIIFLYSFFIFILHALTLVL